MKLKKRNTRLTNRAISTARPKASEYTLWDSTLNHFGLRVYPSGVRSFIVQIRVQGRMRKITLGRFPATGIAEARKQAATLLARIWSGEPIAPVRKPKAPLFRDFAVCYRERRKCRWKPSSLETFDIYLRNRLMPHFGRLRLDTIDHARVSAWFDTASAEKPGAANRAFEILRAMLNTARQWGELGESVPDACANIVKNPRRPVARYLNREELNRLGTVLDRHEKDHPWPVAAIRLLTLTGARLSEVLNLRWDELGDVSEEGYSARLTHSKTGPRTIWLGPDAAQLVARLPRDEHSVRIFPEDLTSDLLYRFWCDVREQAGLSGLRIHDCRHTWASQGIMNGVGLPTVGKMLGHRRHRTTALYAHLDDATLRDAAAQSSLIIARAMRYKAQPQLNNASSDTDDELPHGPEPQDEEHVTRVQHPEHDALDHKIRVLPTDVSAGKAVNPKTPDGFFRI